jgi:peptidoglycan/xylan/chitin deacetylase (PgdA/CDA1 family)
LKKYQFNDTFFITHAFMADTVHFLTWKEIGELYRMGFEIGNHSWTHPDFSQPVNAVELAGELGLVNWMLMSVGVPRPVSFAWTGNGFGPEAVKILQEQGILFARRGMQPEVPYGSRETGPVFRPETNHPLLIPTTRDAYPDLTFSDFKRAIRLTEKNRIVVLQFHGVPDPVHPWVHTDPEMLDRCLKYLKEHHYRVISMKELGSFLPDHLPDDPLLNQRYVLDNQEELKWPAEVIASRRDSSYWIRNMLTFRFSPAEMSAVLAWPEAKISDLIRENGLVPLPTDSDRIQVIPYPGGRHPRIHFKEGMLSPMRGTKAGIFLPWKKQDYLVLDLPEAVFSQFGLTFLAHKHIPTLFDLQHWKIKNNDWIRHPDGHLSNRWDLPNRLVIGAEIYPGNDEIGMSLWLFNGTRDTTFTGLQTQICIMFKGAPDFDRLTNENKVFREALAAVQAENGERWILTAWQRCGHVWGNEDCPCMHSDPVLPDCAPGDTVRVNGRIWFTRNGDPDFEMAVNSEKFSASNKQ